jgi:hypothetical protein
VLASATFRRSATSQRFLRYVCELKLKGESSRINEYLLGLELFSRGPEYSPSEDAVVRRSAHMVRRKLDAYYANDGRPNPVRIEMPIGHYEPEFRWQPTDADPQNPAATQGQRRQSQVWWVALVACACAACLAVGWWAGRRSPVQTPVPRAVDEIWGPWLKDPEGVSIVFANSKTAVVHHLPDQNAPDHHPLHFSLPPLAEQELRRQFGFPESGYLFIRPSDLKTAIAESTSGVQLSQFFGRWQVPVRATQSRLIN